MDDLVKMARGESAAHFDGNVKDRRTIGALLASLADAIESLQARVLEHDRLMAEKDAELAAARDKALEDAARMVDCACECREAVLTANTRVERWTACGRDPCGALDAAAIRAMKGERG